MDNKILLEKGETYAIPIKNGYLEIRVSIDEDYPGIDVEYVSNNEHPENLSRPRVLIEAPIDEDTGVQDKLRVLVWRDNQAEDYTDLIEIEGANFD